MSGESPNRTTSGVWYAREAGCDDFLPKPLRPRTLLARILQLFQEQPEVGSAHD